ncbi:MAG TPA: hypothetical protein VKQ36_04350 [Ktedonobacterales bacterium]|nr:hypothetical protein [Ktedonobacterales bacterium]
MQEPPLDQSTPAGPHEETHRSEPGLTGRAQRRYRLSILGTSVSFSGSTLVGVALFFPLMIVTLQFTGCRGTESRIAHYTYTGLTLPLGGMLFFALVLVPGIMSAILLIRQVIFPRVPRVRSDALLSFIGVISFSVGILLGIMLSRGPFLIVDGRTIGVQYEPAFYVACVGSATELGGSLLAFYALCPTLIPLTFPKTDGSSRQINAQAPRASPLWGVIGSLSGLMALASPFEILALLALTSTFTRWDSLVVFAAIAFFLVILPLVAIHCRYTVSRRAQFVTHPQGTLYLALLGEAWSYAAWLLALILLLSISLLVSATTPPPG